jgi:hypothetical protein
MRRTAPILLLLLAPLTSCQCFQQPVNPKASVFIARYSWYDAFTQTHILNLLEAQGIAPEYVCQMGVCDLSVPGDQQAAALKLLRLELRDRNFLAILKTGHGLEQHAPAEKAWQMSRPRLEHQALVRLPHAEATTPLGVALRDASVTDALAQFPYVVAVETLPRTFLDRNRVTQTGHDFIIGLAETPDAPAGTKLGVQVHNGQSWDRPWFSYQLPQPSR